MLSNCWDGRTVSVAYRIAGAENKQYRKADLNLKL